MNDSMTVHALRNSRMLGSPDRIVITSVSSPKLSCPSKGHLRCRCLVVWVGRVEAYEISPVPNLRASSVLSTLKMRSAIGGTSFRIL
jgi:hypothetical protein